MLKLFRSPKVLTGNRIKSADYREKWIANGGPLILITTKKTVRLKKDAKHGAELKTMARLGNIRLTSKGVKQHIENRHMVF